MAAKFSAKIDEKSLKAIRRKLNKLQVPIGGKEANKLGSEIKREMKRFIRNGVSPMEGRGFGGKFPPYKNPDKYPGKRKRKTKVNLRLTGAFLKGLKRKAIKLKSKKGFAIEIGYPAPEQAIKEKGHREGVNKQPKRPTIPSHRGETFAKKIQLVYLQFVLKLHREIGKRRN